ncbi:hypothetical protein [Helicobacter sp. 23-1045]
MLGFLGRLYQKVIISIDIDLQICRVKIAHPKNAEHNESKTFRTVNGDLPIEAAKYIRHIQNRYPFTYIATISRVAKQGLIEGNKLKKFEDFSLNPHKLLIMLLNKKWFVYIDKDEMAHFKGKFSKVRGADFIFSPFCLVYEKIKSRLDSAKKLYILQENTTCTLLIADIEGVYFGNYIIFSQDSAKSAESSEVVKFETIEEIDDTNENIIIKDFEKGDEVANLSDLNIANTLIATIKETLNNFYKDERYASDFIEELLILDACGISDYSITHLTNNIMMETQFLRVDACDEIEKLAKMELKL